MPAFILPGKENPAFKRLDTFEQAYVEAMFFTDTPENESWSFHDLHESALRKIRDDCAAFRADQVTLDAIAEDESQAGHDFWLTRQGHGAGFWDGDWPKAIGEQLTARAKAQGECWPYKGDDGQIYF